jgi:hypothetical protein
VFASGSYRRYCCRSFLCCLSPSRCSFNGSPHRPTDALRIASLPACGRGGLASLETARTLQKLANCRVPAR